MEEIRDVLVALWSRLSRDQKQAVLVLSTSFPLGLLSVGVGIFSASYFLLAIGLGTLGIGIYSVIHCGLILLKVIAFVLKFVVYSIPFILKLPFVLVGIVKREVQENVSDLSTGGVLTSGDHLSPVQDRKPLHETFEESPPDIPFGWFDVVFAVWFILAAIQLYSLCVFFFGA